MLLSINLYSNSLLYPNITLYCKVLHSKVYHVVQCYGHAEQQVVGMELDRREAEAKEAEKRLQKLGAKP